MVLASQRFSMGKLDDDVMSDEQQNVEGNNSILILGDRYNWCDFMIEK